MAKDVGKPGLTGFGWLLLAGGAAAYFSNKDRRDKVLSSVKGFTGKLNPTGAKTDTSTQQS
ncbi:hypothetical protein [uncultured Sphingomonas sp.]|uniref:hypothetical protein n=1 Tax=uncultured Sphingomonas sp. TaxID=158754 RepID=UPI0025F4DDA1|nr:hypothetical protein [uncultured Sphingomonas sp.]